MTKAVGWCLEAGANGSLLPASFFPGWRALSPASYLGTLRVCGLNCKVAPDAALCCFRPSSHRQIRLAGYWGPGSSLTAQQVMRHQCCSAGDTEDVGLVPVSGRSPAGGKWQPKPVFLPGESCGQRSLAGYSPWDGKESAVIQWLSTAQLRRQEDVLVCLSSWSSSQWLWELFSSRTHSCFFPLSTWVF